MSSTKRLIGDIVIFTATQVVAYYAVRTLLNHTLGGGSGGPSSGSGDTKKNSASVFKRLGINEKQLHLTEHERAIATEIIVPDDIDESFDDIGGLDDIIENLQEAVIFPLKHPQLFEFKAGLFGAPKGVLLYGPPGCGKTMLAKALAKESGATFINMHVSTLSDKWYGESNKLVSALFSLAKKLQPCIIFIDEIDSFMRERSKMDHEVTATMKAEFMALWDGLTSGTNQILVMGATNRMNDIDSAILRRMPKRFSVKLPDANQRRKILTKMLADVDLDPSFNIDRLVENTQGLSGSDIKELCRNAILVPIRQLIKSNASKNIQPDVESLRQNVRPLKLTDFIEGASDVELD